MKHLMVLTICILSLSPLFGQVPDIWQGKILYHQTKLDDRIKILEQRIAVLESNSSSSGGECFSVCDTIIEIGDWNMDSIGAKKVLFNINYKDIRAVEVVIRDDSDTDYDLLDGISSGVITGGVGDIGFSSLALVRIAGGAFDNTAYNATSFNRGFVLILYE